MPERTTDELRLQIASERQGLANDVDELHGQVRSLKPVAIAGVIGLVLLSRRKYAKTGIKLLWKLR